MSEEPILELAGVSVGFPTEAGRWRTVVDRVSLGIRSGDRFGLVGESGAGKSLTALAAIGLVPEPGAILCGSVRVAGTDLGTASSAELRRLRGGVVGVVFQEAASLLNPVFSVGYQVAETVRCHRPMTSREARAEALRLLGEAGLEGAGALYRAYPHQLSGGQVQRVMVALALAGRPQLLIADEPTTALDVVAQARILALIRRICDQQRLALLLISHDLALVQGFVDRVLVMFAGEVVEEAPVRALFRDPLHPYTRSLLMSARPQGTDGGPARPGREWPEDGCRYVPRCSLAEPECSVRRPPLEQLERHRSLRCPVQVRRARSGA
jgi:oligopeptide/dipeptide ABC transporter ATP-binding protein